MARKDLMGDWHSATVTLAIIFAGAIVYPSAMNISDILDRAGTEVPARYKRMPVSALLRMVGALSALSMLAACASARVSDVTVHTITAPQPTEVLVAVTAAADLTAEEAVVARQIASKLQTDLSQRLTNAHIATEPFMAAASHSGAVLLRVEITKADPGNPAERFLIGFGLGRAALSAQADLESSDAQSAYSMTTFKTAGNSGYAPGLILPGGVALATGKIIHLAIGGGIKIITGLRGGLDRTTRQTAAAIVEQLQKHYGSEGWRWPGRAELRL